MNTAAFENHCLRKENRAGGLRDWRWRNRLGAFLLLVCAPFARIEAQQRQSIEMAVPVPQGFDATAIGFSPNRKFLYFSFSNSYLGTGFRIGRYDLRSKRSTFLYGPVSAVPSDVPVLSPSGRFLAFSLSGKSDSSDNDCLADTMLLDVRSRKVTRLTRPRPGASVCKRGRCCAVNSAEVLGFSRDETKLYFQSGRGDLIDVPKKDMHVFAVNLNSASKDISYLGFGRVQSFTQTAHGPVVEYSYYCVYDVDAEPLCSFTAETGQAVAFGTERRPIVNVETGEVYEGALYQDGAAISQACSASAPDGLTKAIFTDFSPEDDYQNTFGKGAALYFLNLQTRELTKSSLNVSSQARGRGADCSMAWTEDQQQLLFGWKFPRLYPGDTRDDYELFIYRIATNSLRAVSKPSFGTHSDQYGSYDAVLDAHGKLVAFTSGSGNLVSGDRTVRDLFVAKFPS